MSENHERSAALKVRIEFLLRQVLSLLQELDALGEPYSYTMQVDPANSGPQVGAWTQPPALLSPADPAASARPDPQGQELARLQAEMTRVSREYGDLGQQALVVAAERSKLLDSYRAVAIAAVALASEIDTMHPWPEHLSELYLCLEELEKATGAPIPRPAKT